MDTLPVEIIHHFMLQLPYADLMAYCCTSTVPTSICGDDTFWRDRYLRDYGTLPRVKVYSWRQVYADRCGGMWEVSFHSTRLPLSLGIYRSRVQAVDTVIAHIKWMIANREYVFFKPINSEQYSYGESFLRNYVDVIGSTIIAGYPEYERDTKTYYRQLEATARETLTLKDMIFSTGPPGSSGNTFFRFIKVVPY